MTGWELRTGCTEIYIRKGSELTMPVHATVSASGRSTVPQETRAAGQRRERKSALDKNLFHRKFLLLLKARRKTDRYLFGARRFGRAGFLRTVWPKDPI